jgi:hypothetical protein
MQVSKRLVVKKEIPVDTNKEMDLITSMDVAMAEQYCKVNNFETYKYEETSYGIKLFDKENDTYNNKYKFKDFIEFTKEGTDKENYYLLIDKESPNFDETNKHTLGYSVLSYFLGDMTL